MNKWTKTLLFLLGSAFLTRWIPFNSLFRNLDTMIHEFGHALTTLLLSGKVLRIELYADHSGVTYSAIHSGARAILTAISGYPVASLFAFLLFYLYVRGKWQWGLWLASAVALIELLLYVRGAFGMTWLAGFIVLNLLFLLRWPKVGKYYYVLLAFLTLEESVMGTLVLLWSAVTSPSRAGDAANLARLTPMPAVFWAGLFFAFSLFCATLALSGFMRSQRRGRTGEKLTNKLSNS